MAKIDYKDKADRPAEVQKVVDDFREYIKGKGLSPRDAINVAEMVRDDRENESL